MSVSYVSIACHALDLLCLSLLLCAMCVLVRSSSDIASVKCKSVLSSVSFPLYLSFCFLFCCHLHECHMLASSTFCNRNLIKLLFIHLPSPPSSLTLFLSLLTVICVRRNLRVNFSWMSYFSAFSLSLSPPPLPLILFFLSNYTAIFHVPFLFHLFIFTLSGARAHSLCFTAHRMALPLSL